MGTFVIERVVSASPAEMWTVLTDWAGYARWIPLTTMRLDQGPTRVGWTFAGLTGLGRVRFADVMRITDWVPPSQDGTGTFRLVKVGRLLAGWAEVTVLPLAGGQQTRLVWRENIVIRPTTVGRLVAPLTDLFNRALFSTVVDAMATEAVSPPGRSGSRQNPSGR
jgi:uncharacterized protein YndB with AHSA1/START domain